MAISSTFQPVLDIIIAFAAGICPVLIWLWVWEHEDKHPEPVKLVFLAFLAGAIGVAVVIPLEVIANRVFTSTPMVILVWAAIEEAVKYCACYTATLWRAENHEPIDGMMYMIITALGFSAVENALFILHPLLGGNTQLALSIGVDRFFGASVIHIISSGAIGYALAISFYRDEATKTFYTALGLCTAIVLHAGLNLSILFSVGGSQIGSLYISWVGIIALVLLFERIKKIRKRTAVS
jgi:RsiW-degrading membrane proteinase PrsW (M82 family)